MSLDRRGFLKVFLPALVAAPAIVRFPSLMPVKALPFVLPDMRDWLPQLLANPVPLVGEINPLFQPVPGSAAEIQYRIWTGSRWVEPAGQKLEREVFPELFKTIGTMYGADDDKTFKLPHLLRLGG